MSTSISTSELRASIERHNDTFEMLLKLIPARYYLSNEPDEAEVGTLSPTLFTGRILRILTTYVIELLSRMVIR